MEADKCTFWVSDSVGLQPQDLRQRRTSTSDHLQQRRTSISDSVGLQSPTASDFNLQQLAYQLLNKFYVKVAKGARMPDDLFQMLKVYRWGIKEAREGLVTKLQEEDRNM